MRPKTLFYPVALVVLLVSSGARLLAAWTDPTAGLPWAEHYSARSLGTDGIQLCVLEDKLGRVFIGSQGLLVNDGTGWRTYPAGSAGGIRALEFGPDGRLWMGGLNELGYYTEPSIGHFEFHSLLPHLPEAERQVGHIWGLGLVGEQIYFIGREKIYRWDGSRFKIWSFPSHSRLFVVKADGATWFHHLETGLHRLSEDGPQLEFAATSLLPDSGILGLHRSSAGLVFVSSAGFSRPGTPAQKVFSPEVNRLVEAGRLTAYAALPDGNHLVGTINGGLILVSATGELLRIIDTQEHPAVGPIQGLLARPDGQVWCASIDGVVRLDLTGRTTLFNARAGLEGGAMDMDVAAGVLSNASGVFRLRPAPPGRAAQFNREPGPREIYTSLLNTPGGLLLGRHGGLDRLRDATIQPVYGLTAKGVYRIIPSAFQPGSYLVSESDALVRLTTTPEGGFTRTAFAAIPDFVRWLAEDERGRVWAGTQSLGAFVADPSTGQIEPVLDPDSGQPLKGLASFSRSATDLLVFVHDRVLRAAPDGTGLHSLTVLPSMLVLAATPVPSGRQTVVAFKRTGGANVASWAQGLGVLTIAADGQAHWHELDLPALESIGGVQMLRFAEEGGRPVLWLGGTEGVLRLDYAAIPPVVAPPAPFIRLDTARSGATSTTGTLDFPFADHHVAFQLFTGDATRTKDWLVQTRLGQAGAWSAATTRRAFDFSNLSEGDYRFEARTLNAAGQASAPAGFAFRILPPWYRSTVAYLGYALALAVGVGLTIRIRERRLLAEQEKLEQLVQVRTAELVKANAAKDDFLAGVSHEIRNPMNGVIGISESLRTAGLDAESQRKFGLLRACADHLASLLEDLLDLSKMSAGVIELEPRPFDLTQLVDSVTAMASADSAKYRIPVEVAISPGVPRHLVGDPRRIRQILLNFVSNALKFSGRGTVEVTVWCQPAGSSDRTEVIFAVTDEGPGISAEEQARLFKRFERGAAARGGRVPGTGLGLALCKGYAEKMGGRIWLESEPGRGSCFYFSAPFTLAPEPVPEPAAPADAAPAVPRLALVVDDQEYNRVVLADLLGQLGYAAHATGDGAEALALAGRHDFGAVFLDYDLPGLGGLDIARGLRALPGASARACIFATTAFNTPAKQQECLDAGMDAFLGKPVTLERLRKALAAAGITAAPPPPAPRPAPPADGLANLRLLATKKQVAFTDEVALYLSEMQVELEQLTEAVNRRHPADAAHYAHRLCGRCSFIYERELEHLLRRIEEAAAKGDWAGVGRLCTDLPALAGDLRLRMASSGRAAPPA